MKSAAVATALLASTLLGGCAAPIVGSLTLSHLSTIATATTMTMKGKGIGEVALDVATGKDCRFVDGILRESRDICETPGSAATEKDFKGVIALLRRDDAAVPAVSEEAPTMVAEAQTTDTVILRSPGKPGSTETNGQSQSVQTGEVAALPANGRTRLQRAYRRTGPLPRLDTPLLSASERPARVDAVLLPHNFERHLLDVPTDGVTTFWTPPGTADEAWPITEIRLAAKPAQENIPRVDQLPEPLAIQPVAE